MTQRLRKMQTTFRRQSFAVRLWIYVILLGLYSSLAVLKEYSPLELIGDVPTNLHALLGLVLTVLLVFRTNTAYDRWWEGRKLWGQLLNESRTLVIKVKQLVNTSLEDRKNFVHLVISFAYALKDHLREPVSLQDHSGFEKADARPRHVPVYLISQMYARLRVWREENRVDGYTALLLDRQATAYSDICGACERIRNTPLVQSYRTYVQLCMVLYLVTLPWGLVEQLRVWTIPATMIISFFMLGLEMIARAIEDPFGTDRDDLPIDDLCRINETTLHEILRQPDLPAPFGPA